MFDQCIRVNAAYATIFLSWLLNKAALVLPPTLEDAANAITILSGLFGACLAIQQMYYNRRRQKLKEQRRKDRTSKNC